jgi:hypothetical protein
MESWIRLTCYDTITAAVFSSMALRKKDVEERGWNSGFSAKGPTIAEGEGRRPGTRVSGQISDPRWDPGARESIDA